jgi:hypothetical protein
MAFVKGQSGNPGGRRRSPVNIEDLRAAAREHTAQALATLVEIAENKKATAAARVAAASQILDRGWGKPEQAVQHSGQVGIAVHKPDPVDDAL